MAVRRPAKFAPDNNRLLRRNRTGRNAATVMACVGLGFVLSIVAGCGGGDYVARMNETRQAIIEKKQEAAKKKQAEDMERIRQADSTPNGADAGKTKPPANNNNTNNGNPTNGNTNNGNTGNGNSSNTATDNPPNTTTNNTANTGNDTPANTTASNTNPGGTTTSPITTPDELGRPFDPKDATWLNEGDFPKVLANDVRVGDSIYRIRPPAGYAREGSDPARIQFRQSGDQGRKGLDVVLISEGGTKVLPDGDDAPLLIDEKVINGLRFQRRRRTFKQGSNTGYVTDFTVNDGASTVCVQVYHDEPAAMRILEMAATTLQKDRTLAAAAKPKPKNKLEVPQTDEAKFWPFETKYRKNLGAPYKLSNLPYTVQPPSGFSVRMETGRGNSRRWMWRVNGQPSSPITFDVTQLGPRSPTKSEFEPPNAKPIIELNKINGQNVERRQFAADTGTVVIYWSSYVFRQGSTGIRIDVGHPDPQGSETRMALEAAALTLRSDGPTANDPLAGIKLPEWSTDPNATAWLGGVIPITPLHNMRVPAVTAAGWTKLEEKPAEKSTEPEAGKEPEGKEEEAKKPENDSKRWHYALRNRELLPISYDLEVFHPAREKDTLTPEMYLDADEEQIGDFKFERKIWLGEAKSGDKLYFAQYRVVDQDYEIIMRICSDKGFVSPNYNYMHACALSLRRKQGGQGGEAVKVKVPNKPAAPDKKSGANNTPPVNAETGTKKEPEAVASANTSTPADSTATKPVGEMTPNEQDAAFLAGTWDLDTLMDNAEGMLRVFKNIGHHNKDARPFVPTTTPSTERIPTATIKRDFDEVSKVAERVNIAWHPNGTQ